MQHIFSSFKRHGCSNCEKTFAYKVTLRRHEMRCKGLTCMLKCELCGKSVDNSQMYDHLRSLHAERKHECPICKKKFRENWYLKKHILMHNGELKHPCDICGLMCASKASAEMHKKAIHTKELSAFCDICGKGFITVNQMNFHKKRSHQPEGEPVELIPCSYEGCSKSYRSAGSLKFHLLTHMAEKPVYPCPHCSKVLHHPISLKCHMRINHTNGTKITFNCHICRKELASLTSLKNHIRTHTGEKPFSCAHCDKLFNTKASLRIHQVVHTKERPYVCAVCKKGYTQYGSLKGHFIKAHPNDQWDGVGKE